MNTYKTTGVCSQAICFDLDGDTIKRVEFIGGCFREYPGRRKAGRGHEGIRRYQQVGGN